jgi:non-specific serine/threonine protein kinase
VSFVDLASLRDPDLVLNAVATALGLPEDSGRAPLDVLLDALRPRQLLLIVDNCEHLLDACASLLDVLLRTSPRVQVLATSREPLRVAGEMTWQVPPLSMPNEAEEHVLERVERYDAVQLFLERARDVLPSFRLTERNAGAIGAMCRRLDGMPLAIELAAARTRVLDVEQIGARLDDRFRLLAAGSRTAPPRHQTLRGTIAWSYDLLEAAERRLFDRLSIFVGGWSLAAAEGVCSGNGIDADSVLDLLTALVDKSLVIAEPEASGGMRYRLLETLRQFGHEHLASDEYAADVGRQHAAFFLDLAERAEPEMYGPDQGAWYRALRLEQDNIRAALRWYLERSLPEALRMAAAMWWFWHQHYQWTEGRAWLEWTLGLPAASGPDTGRVQALMGAGFMAAFQGDLAVARDRLDTAVALARDQPADFTLGRAIGLLGIVYMFQGDFRAGQDLIHEALTSARHMVDVWNQSMMLRLLAVGAIQQDQATAGALLDESLATARASGDPWAVAMTLSTYGDLARSARDYRRAERFYVESIELFRQHGVGSALGSVLHNLGYVFLRQCNPRRARSCFNEAITLFRNMDDRRGLAECLTGLACVSAALHHAEYAVGLFSAAHLAFERLGTVPSPQNRADADLGLETVRAMLDGETFAACWASGRQAGLDQVVASTVHERRPS